MNRISIFITKLALPAIHLPLAGPKMVSGKVRQNQTSQTSDQNGYTQPEMHKRSLKIIEGSFVHFFDNLFSMNAGRKSDPMHGS
ncbi:hypothetical protein [Allobaculum sp. JKK-2023]|uniref:hypothetical protein n=1 Tax=Allobaculum sp. JKK-2023 TaxID=3108943 RepID=UPI002B05676D|nr:hypothetical protein [Allobaculum sp. JKK-2023]